MKHLLISALLFRHLKIHIEQVYSKIFDNYFLYSIRFKRLS